MTIEKLTRDNFALSSLDGFVRTQPVTEVYRKFGSTAGWPGSSCSRTR